MNDDYDTKDDKITPYKLLVEEIKQHFSNISFEKIPRVQNISADAMATARSLLDMLNNETQFEFVAEKLMVSSYEIPDSKYICVIVGPKSP